MADPVQLTDLDVITRYSIAVRKATADRDELIEALRADLAWLERGQRRPRPAMAEADSGGFTAEPAAPTRPAHEAAPDLPVTAAARAPEPESQPAAASARPPIRRMPATVSSSAARRTTSAKRAAATPPAKNPATKKATVKKAAAKKPAAKETAARKAVKKSARSAAARTPARRGGR